MAVKLQVVLALLVILLPLFAQGHSTSNSKNSTEKYEAQEISNKSQVGILRLRGFRAEVHYAITRDGYHLNLVRIINPFMAPGSEKKRPILFNHGLLESSTIWLINSRNVTARKPDNLCWSEPSQVLEEPTRNNATDFRNAAMMFANNGYDVWLLSMRGTDWSLYHEIMDRSKAEFWDYSLDQFAQDDVPTAIEYIRRVTNAPKVAYVGHSQATFSIFGLLATKPHYARIIEPVFAIAPVAYFYRIKSVSRVAFLALVDGTEDGPVPESAKQIRQSLSNVCSIETPLNAVRAACSLVEHLISGGSNKNWPSGYYSHVPYFTSLKVMRHFGQLIKNKNFAMYDHGQVGNMARYGQLEAPLYKASAIESRSMVLVWTRADVVSAPADVRQFISELKVPLHRNIFIDRELDHFDMITHEDSAHLVNKPMLDILEDFEQREGLCAKFTWPKVVKGGGWTNKFGGGGGKHKAALKQKLNNNKKGTKNKQQKLDLNALERDLMGQ